MTPRPRVLLTGSHGYIGAVMSPVLEQAGYDVVALDSLLFDGCDFGPGPSEPPGWPVDVRDISPRHLEGLDAVVHLAALSNDPMGDLDPSLTFDINLNGSVNLARCAKEAGVARFVFASSCSMYGQAEGDSALDEDAPLRPITPYAESKVRFEDELWRLADDSFAACSMRNATAFGVSPRLRLDIVVNNLSAWAHATGAVRLQSNGLSWRPLVHIEDISRAAATLVAAPVELVAGQAYNIGTTAENHLVRDVASMVHERYPGSELTYAEGAGVDPRSYRVDFGRFAEAFPDHRFRWTVRDGIDELMNAFTERGLVEADLSGDRYIRLNHLKRLRSEGLVDASLRPQGAA